MMERATDNPFPSSSSASGGSRPTTINVSPSQHLEHLPIAALLAFVPRLRTTYRVLNSSEHLLPATGRAHYRLRLGAGQTLYVSDNLLDLVRLIDGRRSIQALTDALAEQQGRPVHPAEIVYLLRRQLVPSGLAELSLPLALPEPKPATPPGFPTRHSLVPYNSSGSAVVPMPETSSPSASRPRAVITRPLDPPYDDLQWIPPGRRAERLRATRRPPLRRQGLRRASYVNLVATFLVILTAGAAFAFAHTGFSRASFTPFNLSTFFGGPTPTATVLLHQPTPTPRPPLPPMRYVVRDGDTLAKIAARFKVTVAALLLVNNLKSPAQLQYEQILIIPTVYHQGANPANLAYPIFYVVQQGDNLYTIARFFGTTSDTLIRYNRLNNPALIKPGDSLVIPAPTPS